MPSNCLVDEINMPDISICSNSSVNILRCDFMWNNGSVYRLDECSSFIMPEITNLGEKFASIFKYQTLTIIGLEPDYHEISIIESEVSHFPFNEKPFQIPNGTS